MSKLQSNWIEISLEVRRFLQNIHLLMFLFVDVLATSVVDSLGECKVNMKGRFQFQTF
jgi:hypothetical protein